MKNFSLSRVTLSALTIGLLLANTVSIKAMEERESTLNRVENFEQQSNQSYQGLVRHIKKHHNDSFAQQFSCPQYNQRQESTLNKTRNFEERKQEPRNQPYQSLIHYIQKQHTSVSISSINNDPESSFPSKE